MLDKVLHGLLGNAAQLSPVTAVKARLDFARSAAGELEPSHHVVCFGELRCDHFTGLGHQPGDSLHVVNVHYQLGIGRVGAFR